MRRSGYITTLGATTLALGIVLAWMISTAALAQEVEPTTEALEEQIWELRFQASYAEAAELALELLALKQGDAATPDHEIGDAERLAELLDTVAGLPDDVQLELAEADSLVDVLLPLWDEARFEEGVEVARRQLGIRRRILGELRADVSESLNELGLFLGAQGSYAEAEKHLREALANDRVILGDRHPDLAMGLSNLGLMLHYNGDNLGAEQLLREALAVQRGVLGDDHLDICFSLNNLALVLTELGEFAEAESLLRRSLAILRRDLSEDDRELPTSLLNLAGLLRLQGDDAAAEPLYREALAVARRVHGETHPVVAEALHGLGVFLVEQRRFDEAERPLREAFEMREGAWGREHPDVARSMVNVGNLLVTQGDYDNGEPLLHEALALFRKLEGNEHPDVAQALSNLASSLRRRGRYAEAEQVLGEAIEIRRNAFGETHPGVAGFRLNLGVVLWWQGKDDEAEAVLEAAAKGYEASRLRAGARMKRTTFRLQSPFRFLAAVRLGLGKPGEAWEAVERGMGRSLADLMFAAQERDARCEKQARVDSLAWLVGQLKEELSACARAAERDATTVAAERFRGARDRLLAAQAELSDLRQEIADEGLVHEAESFPIERIGASLGEQMAVVGWVDVPWQSDQFASWGYVIRDTGEVFWSRLETTGQAEERKKYFSYIGSFKRHLAWPRSALLGVERDARSLWDERILPLLPALESVEELIVIPSGPMIDYPLETLVDRRGVLAGDRYSISYAPSATVYAWLRESGGTPATTEGSRSLLVGDPPFSEAQLAAMEQEEREGERIFANATAALDSATIRSVLAGNERMRAGLPRLPGARFEVLGLTQTCPRATVLVGPEASEQTLVRLAETGALGDFDVIHFATHALVDYDQPERSVLVLSQVGLPEPLDSAMAGTRVYDGLVSAGEIIREWELDADLVTLSACETARGRMVMGEGSVGFAHAFLESGARSVVVGLWKVQDEATALLMRRFYENLFGKYEDERKGRVGEPMSKARALQDAKMWLRGYTDEHGQRPYEHPYYWSAFVLIGDRG